VGLHEYVYADRVLQTVLQYLKENPGREAGSVKVELGELLGVTPQSLKHAFGLLARDTQAATAKLVVRTVHPSVVCNQCGFKGAVSHGEEHVIDPVFACPKCGSPLSVKMGSELKVTGIS
jgi:hydrogenase nickel insertion protein HypA